MSEVAVLPAVSAFLQREHGHYINGNSLPGQGPLRPVINPATAQEVAQVRDGG
ncbi:MAG TPA: NAD-dependent phenylacetaldehyde dehydrogenase, partial [Erwinia persicina]|nr:NAD-dependent phenylacetaldehyde dehydrogenase [Erwinia persicina]